MTLGMYVFRQTQSTNNAEKQSGRRNHMHRNPTNSLTLLISQFLDAATCVDLPRFAQLSCRQAVFQDFLSPPLAQTCLTQLPIACISGFLVAAACLHLPSPAANSLETRISRRRHLPRLAQTCLALPRLAKPSCQQLALQDFLPVVSPTAHLPRLAQTCLDLH